MRLVLLFQGFTPPGYFTFVPSGREKENAAMMEIDTDKQKEDISFEWEAPKGYMLFCRICFWKTGSINSFVQLSSLYCNHIWNSRSDKGQLKHFFWKYLQCLWGKQRCLISSGLKGHYPLAQPNGLGWECERKPSPWKGSIFDCMLLFQSESDVTPFNPGRCPGLN